jgi:hypothetical protein
MHSTDLGIASRDPSNPVYSINSTLQLGFQASTKYR